MKNEITIGKMQHTAAVGHKSAPIFRGAEHVGYLEPIKERREGTTGYVAFFFADMASPLRFLNVDHGCDTRKTLRAAKEAILALP